MNTPLAAHLLSPLATHGRTICNRQPGHTQLVTVTSRDQVTCKVCIRKAGIVPATTTREHYAEAELGYCAAQWQDTDTHTDERTRRFALRAAAAAATVPLAPRIVRAARYFRVGEITAAEFMAAVLDHVYGQQNGRCSTCGNHLAWRGSDVCLRCERLDWLEAQA